MALSRTFSPTDPQATQTWIPKHSKSSNPCASPLPMTHRSHGDSWTSISAPTRRPLSSHDSHATALAGFYSPLHLPGWNPFHLDLLRDRTPPRRSPEAPQMDTMPGLRLPIQSRSLAGPAPLPPMRRGERTPPDQNDLSGFSHFTVRRRVEADGARHHLGAAAFLTLQVFAAEGALEGLLISRAARIARASTQTPRA